MKNKKTNKNIYKNKLSLPPRSNVNESLIKILARDLLYEIPKYDSRFVLIRVVLETIARENPRLNEKQVRKSLYNIKNKGYIEQKIIKNNKEGATIKFEFTKKGKEILRGYEFKDIQIEPMKAWDRKWRFIVFDIPEKSRYARNIFRDKLKHLGFFMLQQSTWIYPYECKKEIDFILEFLSLRAYVLFFEVKIDNDAILKKYFKEQKLKL